MPTCTMFCVSGDRSSRISTHRVRIRSHIASLGEATRESKGWLLAQQRE
ncbi:MAG TPA: hypothetical protein VF908_01145 [Gemmatimonadaceae bacterium]